MKILFVASECVPFCKTGGLADVIGALPKELRRMRHDVRIMLPKYKSIRGQEFNIKETGESVRVPIGDRWERADIRTAKTEKGVPVYFINHEGYFGRSGLYRNTEGDYPDNAERFIFFSRAVLEACKAIEFRPDIIHTHDWQTGLVAAYLVQAKHQDAYFQRTACVFTIHNIAYQGIFPKETLLLSGLPSSEFYPGKLEFYDQMNFLKAGLVYADRLTTVSPNYADEIQSSPEFGRGLEGVLHSRRTDLAGILNGLDIEEWDPSRDPFLAKPFSRQSMAGRKDCKAHLQQSLKLPIAPRTPLLGMVARLDPQKGVDLLVDILPQLLARGVQVVVLGQGDPTLQDELEAFEKLYPRNFRMHSDFNDPLAHHIYGGSDLFLMPSRFEPCGLGQLIAMRYGSIPVVSNTGGLHDTVVPVGPRDSGTGFMFYEFTDDAFWGAIQDTLKLYADEPGWSRLQARAMQADFSWQESAQAYVDVYRRSLGRGTRKRNSIKIS